MEVVEGRVVLELLVEIQSFGLVEAREVVVVYVVGGSEMEYAVCLGEMVKVGMELTDIQQGVRVIPVFSALVEGAIGAEEEGEGERVALVLFGYMRHAGVDASAIDRDIYPCAVGSDIMFCGLWDLVSKTKMTPHVVVGFAELIMREDTTQRIVKRSDGLLKRCGVGIEQVFVLVQTICDSNSGLRFLVACGVAARSQKQAEKQVCEMTDWRHKAMCLVISFAKVVKILDLGKNVEQMYMILQEE